MADGNKSLIVVAVEELKTKPRSSSVWFPDNWKTLAAHTKQYVMAQLGCICPSIGYICLNTVYICPSIGRYTGYIYWVYVP